MSDNTELGEELGRVAAGEHEGLGRLSRLLVQSGRTAGAAAVASGKWLAELLVEAAPHIPVRNRQLLEMHHDGATGATLADALVTNASRASAAVGAAAGALMGAEELAPPAWLAIPAELVVETLAIAAIEMKMVAELHEALGRPVPGSGTERSTAIALAWAERRGVTPGVLMRRGGLADVLGRGTRNELLRVVRRRVAARMGRNLSTLAPMFIGVVAGAEVNRRATRSLGDAVIRDLAAS